MPLQTLCLCWPCWPQEVRLQTLCLCGEAKIEPRRPQETKIDPRKRARECCAQARFVKKIRLNARSSSFVRAHGPDRRVFSCSRARPSSLLVLAVKSSSFPVRVALQRVPGHPEAKSYQNLIRNGLLETILEASRPASKPASQAQPLGRVFSTKRIRGQDRRVLFVQISPKCSPAALRPKVAKSYLEMTSWRPFWRPASQPNRAQEAPGGTPMNPMLMWALLAPGGAPTNPMLMWESQNRAQEAPGEKKRPKLASKGEMWSGQVVQKIQAKR